MNFHPETAFQFVGASGASLDPEGGIDGGPRLFTLQGSLGVSFSEVRRTFEGLDVEAIAKVGVFPPRFVTWPPCLIPADFLVFNPIS
jgi:hypothetical protein